MAAAWKPNPQLKVLLNQAVMRAFHKAGRYGVSVAKDKVPVDTGRLRKSISYEVRTINGNVTLILKATMPYAAIIEEGSINRKAKPYLRPALNAISIYFGGNTHISYPHAILKSGKPANPAIKRHNKAMTSFLKRSAHRATVSYRGGPSFKSSRWSKANPD